jgi:hypothetical protein
VVLGVGVAGVVLGLGYLVMSRTEPVNADGASQALMAWDMLHGNLLLSGWTVSDVSFYLTDILVYVAVEAVYGLSADVVHVAAAVIYALLVLVTLAVAKGRTRGREAVVRVGLALAIIAVPAAGRGSWVLLLSPDHTGTGIPLLLTWLVLDRGLNRPAGGDGDGGDGDGGGDGGAARTPTWWLPYAIMLLLAWGQISDPLVTFIGAVPLALVGAVRLWRDGRRRPRHWRGVDAWLVAAGVGSFLLAQNVLLALHLAGGYVTHALPLRFVALSGALENIKITGQVLGVVFGAYFPDRGSPVAVAVGVLHLLGLLAVAAAVVLVALRAGRRGAVTDPVNEVMAVGVLFNVGAFVVSTLPADMTTARQVAVTVPLGAALLARLAGPWLASQRLAARRLLPAFAAVLLVIAGEFAVRVATARPQPAANQDIADWLQANHLNYGLGGFWSANNITLGSGGRVTVAAITGRDKVWAYRWLNNAGWFDPARHDARFVVFDRYDPSVPTEEAVVARFGPPVARHDFQRVTVLIYDRNLLVGLPAYCYPGTAPSIAECD